MGCLDQWTCGTCLGLMGWPGMQMPERECQCGHNKPVIGEPERKRDERPDSK